MSEEKEAPKPALMQTSAPSGTKTVEQWAADKGLAEFNEDGSLNFKRRCPWEFRAAKLRFGWGLGRELTEAQFDAAIKEVASVTQS